MVFKELNKDGGWIMVEYSATWRYGFDFMLDAAQMILKDFGKDLQRVAITEMAGGKFTDITGEVVNHGGNLRECESLREEHGVIAVAGISGTMECPIQITLHNQTNAARVDIPIGQIPDGNPIKDALAENEHIFDTFMNSIEINAYCTDTERRVRAELSQ